MRKSLTALGLVAAAGVLLSGCSAPSGGGSDTIVIAQVGDYSGDWSFYDMPFRDGMKIAVDEVNAAGGIDGVEHEGRG